MPEDKPNIPANLENDPDILAAKKRNILSFLKWQRHVETAKAMGFLFKTFRSEAASLTFGVLTLVTGFFQIKKYVTRHSRETKTESSIPKSGRRLPEAAIEMPAGASTTMAITSEVDILPFQDPGNYIFGVLAVLFSWAFMKMRSKNKKAFENLVNKP